MLPFGLLLAAIAILPLAAPRWWETHGHKGMVALLLAAPLASFLLFAHGAEGGEALGESLHE